MQLFKSGLRKPSELKGSKFEAVQLQLCVRANVILVRQRNWRVCLELSKCWQWYGVSGCVLAPGDGAMDDGDASREASPCEDEGDASPPAAVRAVTTPPMASAACQTKVSVGYQSVVPVGPWQFPVEAKDRRG